MPGNTRTGGVLEAMVLPALDRGGYRHRAQVAIGTRLGCGKHVVDAVAEKDGREVLVSVKWQQVAGTAEQKVPFELICLLDAIEGGPYAKAYLVLGGEGEPREAVAMTEQQDEKKSQREAFEFLREHFRQDTPFTKADLQQQTSWSEKSISTYWSKQFEPFVQPIPPILKGAQQKHQQYVVRVLLVGRQPARRQR